MPEYTVVDGHKNHNGKTYAPGDTINVSDEVAKQLRLKPVTNKEKNKEKAKDKDKDENKK